MDANEARRAADAWVKALIDDPGLCIFCGQKPGNEIRAQMKVTLRLQTEPTASDVAQMREYILKNREADLRTFEKEHPETVDFCTKKGSEHDHEREHEAEH